MASDKAALAESANQGGIDFGADKLNLKESGGAINIKFDKAMIEQFNRGDFTGVRPVILNVTTIPSVLPLLGLSPGREEEQLAAAAS